MSVRMRRPETVKIDISQGDWLLVKKHLTAGEQRRIFKDMMAFVDGEERFQRMDYGPALIAGYLLDWSITDADGKPVVIRDQPRELVLSALDLLDTDCFKEILAAVEQHQSAMEKALEQEKNVPAGATAS